MDDGTYMAVSTDRTTGDQTLELRVVDVSLLSCGCIVGTIYADVMGGEIRGFGPAAPVIPALQPMKITVILDTGSITDADGMNRQHRHGDVVTALDVKAWRHNINARLPYDTKWAR